MLQLCFALGVKNFHTDRFAFINESWITNKRLSFLHKAVLLRQIVKRPLNITREIKFIGGDLVKIFGSSSSTKSTRRPLS
jgi:hypothetical protein